MFTLSMAEWVMCFTVYSMVGWVCESIWCSVGTKKVVNRGFLYGPWCPIYGFGALLLFVVGEPVQQWPWAVFIGALISTSLLEYFTGWLLETLFKAKWWDYSHRKFNIKGRVCLRNALLFGLMGIAAVYYLQPTVLSLLRKITPSVLSIIAEVMVGIFVFDLVRSLVAVMHLRDRLDAFHSAIEELKTFQSAYHWYERGNMKESIVRLHDVCESEPDNKSAAKILAAIEALYLDTKRGGRLLRAFPRFKPHALSTEFDTLKSEWENQIRALKEKAKRH